MCGCGARGGARGARGVVIGWMMRGVALLFLFRGVDGYKKRDGVCAVPFVSPLYIYLSLLLYAIMWRF